MAVMRKRFSSVCSSSSAEEDSANLYDSVPISATNPPSEQEHPYASLLCCHRVQDSLLSSNSSFTGYRGILNWIIILLVLTHAHLFLENFIQHGFLIDVKKVLEHLIEDNCNWPSVNLILAANIFAITALLLERSQEKGVLSPTNTHRLHLTNLGLLLLFPAAVILHEPTISTGGAFFSLWFYIALGMKLYSYQETNRWYRQAHFTAAGTDKNVSVAQKAHSEQLTFRDLYYFLLAPTLCYQRDFPCTPKVRINKLLHRLLEMVIIIQIMVGIVQQMFPCSNTPDPNDADDDDDVIKPPQESNNDLFIHSSDTMMFTFVVLSEMSQHLRIAITFGAHILLPIMMTCWIEPIFQKSENSFSGMDITMRVEHLVGLVAPTHFLWLLFFFLSHSFLNFCAELLCFGDRHFYGDWWNATNLITFWKNWNIPCQKWCRRHVYTHLVDKNVSPSRAELLVFLTSAALCECMIALPLHSCRLWIFLMMVFELLVAVFLGNHFEGNYGNGLVWLCLLLGPPLAVTTYFHDHYISFPHHHHPSSSSPPTSDRSLPSTVFLQPH